MIDYNIAINARDNTASALKNINNRLQTVERNTGAINRSISIHVYIGIYVNIHININVYIKIKV